MSPTVAFALLLGVVGLAVGSFLNVVVARTPEGLSVARPASRCPSCETPILRRDNVPVVSWLVLRGRCRACRVRIPVRYLLVELATALAFAGVALGIGPSWTLPVTLYAVAAGIALTLIDLDVHRLPDAIVLPSYPVVAALLVVAAWGAGRWDDLLRAAIGGVILFAAYLLMMIAYPSGMGAGDVKLSGLLGALLAFSGWGAFAVGAFAAFLLGGVFAGALMLARRAGRRSGIPFGPWMIGGALVGLVWGRQLFDAYLGLIV